MKSLGDQEYIYIGMGKAAVSKLISLALGDSAIWRIRGHRRKREEHRDGSQSNQMHTLRTL